MINWNHGGYRCHTVRDNGTCRVRLEHDLLWSSFQMWSTLWRRSLQYSGISSPTADIIICHHMGVTTVL